MSTIRYNPSINNRNSNLYIEEYYSSVDTQIKFNGKEFNNASYIQFSVQENVKPIYGYNSSTFDDVAIGNRLIVGVIRVPVKNNENESDISFSLSGNSNVIDNSPGWSKNIVNDNNSKEDNFKYSDMVKRYQDILLNKGYPVNVTGYLDTDTRNAITKYQTNNNLYITGNFDNDTMYKLDGEVTYNAKTLNNCILYIGPNERYKQVCTLSGSSRVLVLDSIDEYLLVKFNNKTGYVKKNNIQII